MWAESIQKAGLLQNLAEHEPHTLSRVPAAFGRVCYRAEMRLALDYGAHSIIFAHVGSYN